MALVSYAPVVKGKVLEDPVIRRIAQKHGATPGQVALAWLLAIPGVAAIPKAAGAARQAENLAACDLVLDAEDLAALSGLPKDGRTVNPPFAPDWAA
jgi:2,5-diketo-D-gluconate reductase B